MRRFVLQTVRHSGTHFVQAFLAAHGLERYRDYMWWHYHYAPVGYHHKEYAGARVVTPLRHPLETIKSRYKRGFHDWQPQIKAWANLIGETAEAYYLPVDLPGDKLESMLRLLAFIGVEPNNAVVYEWAEKWPRLRGGDATDKKVPEDLSEQAAALSRVPGLRSFCEHKGYQWLDA